MIETLFENEWLSLKAVREPEQNVHGYIYSHEARCQGRIVVVLPYRYMNDRIQFLTRSEVTPCWAMTPEVSAVTGGYEGGDIADDAVKELQEETGYTATVAELISLGTCYASKSSDTVYSIFAVDLTGREPGEPTGSISEGSTTDYQADAFWIELDEVPQVQDAQFSTAVVRLLLTPQE